MSILQIHKQRLFSADQTMKGNEPIYVLKDLICVLYDDWLLHPFETKCVHYANSIELLSEINTYSSILEFVTLYVYYFI